MAKDPILNDVSDTAFWVAEARVRETKRSDALFKDPLAAKLTGERGMAIEGRMRDAKYVAWTVVVRTRIIDAYVAEMIAEGVDTVINLGAGLDTRPYRLELPAGLRWIEVDFPKIIEHKEKHLAGEKPVCRLERIALDLSREDERKRLFAQLGSETKNALILTEGVVPYLTADEVAALAKDLRAQPSFRHWIVDYVSPELMKYMKSPHKEREMRNAPFRFDPPNYWWFFQSQGWNKREIRYIGEESDKLGRAIPHSWWIWVLQWIFTSKKMREGFKRYNGFALLSAG